MEKSFSWLFKNSWALSYRSSPGTMTTAFRRPMRGKGGGMAFPTTSRSGSASARLLCMEELREILTGGQSFSWKDEGDCFSAVLNGRVYKVRCEEDFRQDAYLENYYDFAFDYDEARRTVASRRCISQTTASAPTTTRWLQAQPSSFATLSTLAPKAKRGQPLFLMLQTCTRSSKRPLVPESRYVLVSAPIIMPNRKSGGSSASDAAVSQ